MKGKFALMAVLWLAIGGTAMAEARIARYPGFPSYPPLDETEARLQQLEWLVNQQQLQMQALRNKNEALRSDLANMITVNDYVTLEWVHGRPTVRFTAVNLQVINGQGMNTNGLGNILIGYDTLRSDSGVFEEECSRGAVLAGGFFEPVNTEAECLAAGATWGLNHKDGSHYLVVGDKHNYSSFSGIVTGYGNTSSSPNASVTGGQYNQATGWGSSVTGGARNRASLDYSAVTGGSHNLASGQASSVTGGHGNVASGPNASVTGGTTNEASGARATVSGGDRNAAIGTDSSVSGGLGGTASGNVSSISGGYVREVQEVFGWAGGAY